MALTCSRLCAHRYDAVTTAERTWEGEQTRCSCLCTSDLRSATLSSTSANRSLQRVGLNEQFHITWTSAMPVEPQPLFCQTHPAAVSLNKAGLRPSGVSHAA